MDPDSKDVLKKLLPAGGRKDYADAVQRLLPAALRVFGSENEGFALQKLHKAEVHFTMKGESVAAAVARLFPEAQVEVVNEGGACAAIPHVGALDADYFLLVDDRLAVVLNSFLDFHTEVGMRALCRHLFVDAPIAGCDVSGGLLTLYNGVCKKTCLMHLEDECRIETSAHRVRYEAINEGFALLLQEKILAHAAPEYERYNYPYAYYVAKVLDGQTGFGAKVVEEMLRPGTHRLATLFGERLPQDCKWGWDSLCSSLELHDTVDALFPPAIDREAEKLHRDIGAMIDREREKEYPPGREWSIYKILAAFLDS